MIKAKFEIYTPHESILSLSCLFFISFIIYFLRFKVHYKWTFNTINHLTNLFCVLFSKDSMHIRTQPYWWISLWLSFLCRWVTANSQQRFRDVTRYGGGAFGHRHAHWWPKVLIWPRPLMLKCDTATGSDGLNGLWMASDWPCNKHTACRVHTTIHTRYLHFIFLLHSLKIRVNCSLSWAKALVRYQQTIGSARQSSLS